jgi:hypothetical protein
MRRWIWFLVLVIACSGSTAGAHPNASNGTPAAAANPTTNWMSYTARAGGFKLRHPDDWFVSEGSNGGLVQDSLGRIYPPASCPRQVYVASCAITTINMSSWERSAHVDLHCWNFSSISTVEAVDVDGVAGVRLA